MAERQLAVPHSSRLRTALCGVCRGVHAHIGDLGRALRAPAPFAGTVHGVADIVIVSCADLADRIEELTAVYVTGDEAAVDASKAFVFNVARVYELGWIDQESASRAVLRPFLGSAHCENFADQLKPDHPDLLDRHDDHSDARGERVGGSGDEPTTT